jgi:hypothetical protein
MHIAIGIHKILIAIIYLLALQTKSSGSGNRDGTRAVGTRSEDRIEGDGFLWQRSQPFTQAGAMESSITFGILANLVWDRLQ